jgi:hypothetical protein
MIEVLGLHFAEVIAMARSYEHSFVHGITVATPCHESWDGMKGDDLSRFCGSCKLNVYNISAMTTEEAEALIIAKEGKLCVRFFRRTDGTILTKDCPKGLKMVRERIMRGAAVVAGLMSVCAAYVISSMNNQEVTRECALQKMKALTQEAKGNLQATEGGATLPKVGQMMMGAPPPPPVAEVGDLMVPQTEIKGRMAAKGNK